MRLMRDAMGSFLGGIIAVAIDARAVRSSVAINVAAVIAD
jgi:hypothetical protein